MHFNVHLKVVAFNIGPHDYVEFFDGTELSSPVLARLGKYDVTQALISSGDAIRVYLYTGQQEDVIGLKLSYIEGGSHSTHANQFIVICSVFTQKL